MSIINSQPLIGASGQGGYFLTKSLRFRSSASAYLSRTPASAGNRKTWTWSAWVKRGAIADAVLFSVGASGSSYFNLRFQDNSGVQEFSAVSENPSTDITLRTSQQFRDPSAWYHLVFVLDTTQATSSNRAKFYVNGSQVTAFSSATYPSQNADLLINNNQAHNIARRASASDLYFDGYMTEVNFIDGQALTPSSFGETSTSTGVWIPKKYTGTYGTNGFYLPFTDVATTSGSNAGLGKDFSGNGNYWNTNNISVTSGSTYDSMKDVPTLTDTDTANYCVLNPLGSRSVGTMQNGNLTWKKSDAAGDNYCCASSISIPSSGKWYWEVTITDGASGANCIGIIPSTSTTQQTANTIPGDFGITTNAFGYYSDGTKRNSGSSTAYGNSFTSGDVIAVAVDTTNGKIWWSKNGTWQASGDPAAGTNAAFTTLSGSYYAASSVRFNGNQHDYNFGQRPFTYTPPTGFVALNTFNLPTPTIGATASTQAGKYFNPVLYTGTGSARSVTGVGFAPDFVWIKVRNAAYDHQLYDIIRGAGKYLYSNSTVSEQNDINQLSSFDSDGFSLGSGVGTNESAKTFVAWCWDANGTGVTNTAGSITSTVSANTTAGFSIVTYTGNNTSGATVGHGLGVTPAMIIGKNRSGAAQNWQVWHQSMGDNVMQLNLTNAQVASTSNSVFLVSSINSSVFALGTNPSINGNSTTQVAYCFAQVAGYSAFGSYTGNGSTDGPFIYTGFRPRYVLIKRTDSSDDWILLDTSRSTYNVSSLTLYANGSYAEDSNVTNRSLDFLSNGFKIRSSGIYINASGGNFIYACFAENPFKFSNAR